MDAKILLGVAIFAFVGAVIVWGIQIYLGIRAHRNEMDDLEGRWK